MHALHRAYWLYLVLLLLSGCAANQQVINNRLTLPEKIEANEGVAVIRVITPRRLSDFHAKWQTLEVVNKKTGQAYRLNDTAQPFATYSIYMGSLPEGQYVASSLESYLDAPANFGLIPGLIISAMSRDFQSLSDYLGTFTVKPGAVTNLGTLICSLPVSSEDKTKFAVLTDMASLAAVVDDMEPTAKLRIANLKQIGWDNTPDSAKNLEALEDIRASSVNVSNMDITPDNLLIAGGPLGTVYLRAQGGKWGMQSVGTFDSITYIRALPDGRIVAGTDNGKYFVRHPQQKLWQVHRIASPDFSVKRIDSVGNHGVAFLIEASYTPTTNTPYTLKVVLKPELENDSPPKDLISFDLGSALNRPVVSFDGQDVLVYMNIVGFSREADQFRINPITLERKKDSVPFWMVDLYPLSDNTLVRNRMNGLSLFSDFSKDNGKTWESSENSGPFISRFTNAQNGYGFSRTGTGWSSYSITLNKTQDGGKNWQPTGSPVEAISQPVIHNLGNQIFLFVGNKIVSTQDDGATWVTEWPTPTK